MIKSTVLLLLGALFFSAGTAVASDLPGAGENILGEETPAPKAKKKAAKKAKKKAGDLDKLDEVTLYLFSPEFIASRSELRRIDADPVPELVKIAKDKRKKPFVRERAIKSMSLFRDGRTRQAFSSMLKGRPDRYFTFVVMAYMEAFGEESVADIKRFLDNKNPEVRMTVVQGFGLFGGQEGYDLLVERNKTESHPRVQTQIQSYVQ